MNHQLKRIIFIHNSPILLGIFDSEALTFIRQLQKRCIAADMILYVDPERKQNQAYKAKLDEIRNTLENGTLFTIERPSLFRGFRSFEKPLYPILEQILQGDSSPRVIHCMGYLLSYVVMSAKRKRFPGLRIHADMRGVLPQECLYYEEGVFPVRLLRYFLAKKMEKSILEHADSIGCVSNEFQKYLVKKYAAPPEKIIVMPLCINERVFHYDAETRKNLRQEFKWGEDFVIVYSGKHQKWQLPQRMMKNIEILLKIIPRSRALILTRLPDAFRSDLETVSPELVNRFEIRSLEHDKVAGALMVSDAAVIFRKNDLVNRVACPTKFAEYLGCGLPVLCTEGIGDLSGLVRSEKLGWVMKDPFSEGEIKEIGEAIRNAPESFFNDESRKSRAGLCRELFSWDQKIDKIIRRYEKLIQS